MPSVELADGADVVGSGGDDVVVRGVVWQMSQILLRGLATRAFCVLVSVSSLSWALLIAVSVDFLSRSSCFCAVSNAFCAASTACWAWVIASWSCCLLMSVGPACAWASAARALSSWA